MYEPLNEVKLRGYVWSVTSYDEGYAQVRLAIDKTATSYKTLVSASIRNPSEEILQLKRNTWVEIEGFVVGYSTTLINANSVKILDDVKGGK